MRQLTLLDTRSVAWHDVPEPVLEGSDDAIVRPLAVATCDLDHAMIQGRAPIPKPIPLGHEFVAEVVSAGDAVTTVGPGDLVVSPFQISCGSCDACRRGHTANCTSVDTASMFGFGAFGHDYGGALSDLVRIPYADAMLVGVPDGVPPATVASASDNIPDGWRTVARFLRERPGTEVLVVGGGAPSIGLYAAGAAVALGASRVDYLDTDTGRLEIARALGATPVEGPPPKHAGRFPVTVDASASVEGLHCALRSTAPDGNCTSVGIYFEAETPIPLFEMYGRCCSFHTGRASARPEIPEILGLVAAGRLHPELVTSAVVDWEDAPEALLEPRTKLVMQRA